MILVLRALGIGDLLTAVPALRGLRHRYPRERIVLAAPGELTPLVRLSGAVDEVAPTAGLGALRPPPDRPRLAVNLHGRGPQSIADLLATEPEHLITHRHPRFPRLDGPPWPDNVHEAVRWCELLEHHGVSADPTDLRLPPPGAESPAPGAVVVHPGAGSPARQWPPERYAYVARRLAAAGHHVVVTGSASERDLCDRVAEEAGLPADRVLAGRLDLTGLAALVAAARLVLCGDTGIGHLATALGTESVLLFGPIPPRLWGPRIDDGRHLVLWAGNVGDPHGRTTDPGLLLVSPERVLRAAERAIARGPVTSSR